MGSAYYIAPEVLRRDYGQQIDLWSLGVVLYRMCVGELPFKGADTVSTLLSVASSNPQPPARINARIPAGLSELVMKLLEKDPAKRVASAQEVAEALRALEAGVPASAGLSSSCRSPAEAGTPTNHSTAANTASSITAG